MTPKMLLVAAVPVLLLAGCSREYFRASTTTPCASAECEVAVSVEEDGLGNCKVLYATPDKLVVQRDAPKPSLVRWRLSGDGNQKYEFYGPPPPDQQPRGVQFKTDNDQVFVQCGAIMGGAEFQCVNNRNAGTYAYTVSVKRKAGGAGCQPLDPMIIND
jgi:hypothetical protein